MFSLKDRKLRILTLLALMGAGFSYFDGLPLSGQTRIQAAPKASESSKGSARRKKAATDKKKAQVQEDEDAMFLKDAEKAMTYLPDIFRCPECGYEQDEPGNCPDHNTIELVKVLSRGRDPLEPAELDGNEDLIVDIPLKGLQFRKDVVVPVASETPELK